MGRNCPETHIDVALAENVDLGHEQDPDRSGKRHGLCAKEEGWDGSPGADRPKVGQSAEHQQKQHVSLGIHQRTPTVDPVEEGEPLEADEHDQPDTGEVAKMG